MEGGGSTRALQEDYRRSDAGTKAREKERVPFPRTKADGTLFNYLKNACNSKEKLKCAFCCMCGAGVSVKPQERYLNTSWDFLYEKNKDRHEQESEEGIRHFASLDSYYKFLYPQNCIPRLDDNRFSCCTI